MKPSSLKRETDDALARVIAREPETAAGKEAASELFRRFQVRVYQWCFRYMREHERALDLSQEVFLGAYQNLSTFAGRSSFSSWLFAIARNRCVSAIRRAPALGDPLEDPDSIPDVRFRPDGEIEDEQEKEALLDLIRKNLAPVEQQAVCMQIFDRMPVEAITEALGIVGSTGARGVLQNARRKLRAALGPKRRDAGGNAE